MQHQPTIRYRGQHRGRKSQEGGFTLIEILMAMTVTVIGLVGLLSLHMTTIKGNQIAAHSAEATTIAQRLLEELRSRSVDDIVSEYGALPIEDALMDTVAGKIITYTPYLSVKELTGVSEDLVLLRIEVRWADDGADPATVDVRDIHDIVLEIVRTRQEAL